MASETHPAATAWKAFVLLAGRAPYWPDEVRALERSAHEVGMVLQALESERLRREVEALRLRPDAALAAVNESAALPLIPDHRDGFDAAAEHLEIRHLPIALSRSLYRASNGLTLV